MLLALPVKGLKTHKLPMWSSIETEWTVDLLPDTLG